MNPMQEPSAASLGLAGPMVFEEEFDWQAGLWVQPRPGHTRSVSQLERTHSGRVAAGRLFMAVYLDAFDPRQVLAVLTALRRLQCVDGSPNHGCFRWYTEEQTIFDTNAAFFIGMNLLALHHWRSRLDDSSQALLEAMLGDLIIWFFRQAATRHHHYPNKFLGDLVCAWLLAERDDALSPQADELVQAMRLAAEYWRDHAWGWGEHLSDGYARVLLDELSMLLLLSRKLPADVRAMYHALFQELLALEDQFDGGPRVPAIRSYAFLGRAAAANYRTRIALWTPADIEALRRGEYVFPFDDWFHRLGWHELAGVPASRQTWLEVPCFDGTVARAWITPQARLGSVSRYPVMADVDHSDWGLSWQSMPVAAAFGDDGWAFLRWHVQRGQAHRHHPARDMATAFLGNALSWDARPSIVGQTHALQRGSQVLAIRCMPRLLSTWTVVEDQWVMSGSQVRHAEPEQSRAMADGTLRRWLLEVQSRPVTLMHLTLKGAATTVHVTQEDAQTVWSCRWTGQALARQESLLGVWLIGWDRDIPLDALAWQHDTAAQDAASGWRIDWPVGEGIVTVKVDEQSRIVAED